jgi:hypothetical protein
MKRILTILLVFILIGVFVDNVQALFQKNSQPKSVFQMSKQEYEDHAVKNCSKDSDESYCRCFYSGILENYTTREVLKMDAEASANPDTYEYTDEQIDLVASCIR